MLVSAKARCSCEGIGSAAQKRATMAAARATGGAREYCMNATSRESAPSASPSTAVAVAAPGEIP